jgi:uncharacterized cofD-like protein
VLSAIAQADIILLGPGSLYTSLLPNLLIKEVSNAIRESRADKIYIANIMTQPGETQGFTLEDHLQAIIDHCGGGLIDVVLANSHSRISEDVLARYMEDKSQIVRYDREKIRAMRMELVEADMIEYQMGKIRHQSHVLAMQVFKIYRRRHNKVF